MYATHNDPNPNRKANPSLCFVDMCSERMTGIGRTRIKTSLAIEKPALALQVLTTSMQ